MVDSDSKDITKDEKVASAKGAAPVVSKARSKNPVVLGKYIINCDAPLEIYNNGPVKAFHAGVKKSGGSGMFALICEKNYTPRFKGADRYNSIINSHCVRVKKQGVVYWPPAKQERYVFIYDGGIGEPLMSPGFKEHLGLKQDVIMSSIVRPLIDVLVDFDNKNFVHGSIRVDNIFGGAGTDMKSIVLGDALSVPASSTQPVLYETIERGMADPIGRGVGSCADDLYALGITLAVLMRASDPLAGMSDEEIIRHKIEFGSYSAITGKDRFTGSILSLLRGLLHDDPTQRTTLEEVSLWMEGGRLTPKQTTREKKAMRPFVLNGESYYRLPILAMDLHKNPKEISAAAEDGSLLKWVERSVEDEKAVERIEESLSKVLLMGKGSDHHERMVSFISMAMDPSAPVRYCGFHIRGGGVGAALFEAVGLQKDIKPFADLFLQDIIFKWLATHHCVNLDPASLVQVYDECRRALRQGTMGHGIERCVYILNDRGLCCSDKLQDYYISSPEALLDAVEDKCTKNEFDGLILDRHMAAFLSQRENRVIDSFLFELNSAEYYQNILGNLNVFAAMQARFQVSSLPGLARVLHNMLPAVLKNYHDKETREKMRKSAKRYMKSGDLVKMVDIFSNPVMGQKDQKEFKAAMQEYAVLESSYSALQDGMENSKDFGRSTGRNVSALFSFIVSLLIVLLTASSYL